ncbi:uncharacterized protein E5676_scaffold775G00410 [Cucumis melo var. makuwa]|uniref:Reverse transcriptase domain-containing protein n=1 Tax=Cucumis melo var. makuwa TaxID=1194695 RepID=A0A5A7TDS9_CUCMM|nr:uncharacterized protein E6C27_scaffold744G00590 [Cucumis melo var. makuwa]TYK01716.1 uncharacterized protein E5676_scaffold775G00410 [Cucumis melo var. makuwa]
MTTFKTPKGIYCYKLMPFGLKNAGTTYQRVMQKVFDDMLHKYVECYVDDLVVKSKRRQDHLKDLKVVFNRLRKYQLRMNPLKCAFGVTSEKFLGFIVRHRGIEIDQSRIDVIQKMPRPKSLHDLRRKASRRIVGARRREGKGTCSLLFKQNLSWAEDNYSPIEKMAEVDYLWTVLLQQYDIVYIPQKAIKGQALANFLANHPIPSDWKLCEDFPDDEVFFTEVMEPWTMYFDGATQRNGAGARQLMERFDSVMLEHVPRIENKRADTLANLATVLTIPDDIALNIPLCQRWIMPPVFSEFQEANVTTSHLIDEEDWCQPIIEYLKHGMLPKDSRHKTKEESIKALKEAHAGVCGAHQSGPKLQFQFE